MTNRLRPAQQLAALRDGARLLGVDAEIILTDRFVDEVRGRTGHITYSDDRQAGQVAAKTVGETILVNNPAIANHGLDDLIRLGMHEAGHVLIGSRREDLDGRRGLAQTDWQWYLMATGSSALEEARIERAVVRQGFPPAEATRYDHVALSLFFYSQTALHSVTQLKGDVDEMIDAGMTALTGLATTLAYIAGAEIEGGFEFNQLELPPHALKNWAEFVEPTWRDRLALYAAVPTCVDPIDHGALELVLLECIELEHATLRSMGFEFRGTADRWGYWNILDPEMWESRLGRLWSEAEGALGQGADRACPPT